MLITSRGIDDTSSEAHITILPIMSDDHVREKVKLFPRVRRNQRSCGRAQAMLIDSLLVLEKMNNR